MTGNSLFRKLTCLLLVSLFFISAANADDARIVWYEDEASTAEVTNDSWMSLESDTDFFLYDGWEYHLWTQYYGTDAITKEVLGCEIDMNGVRVYECGDFFMDCHVPYEQWFALMKNNQIVITITFHTVYGDYAQYAEMEYIKDAPRLCDEHIWKVNRQLEIFAPCELDAARHYLREAYYDRECVVCGLFQRNKILQYDETDSPRHEFHTYGEDNICTADGCDAVRPMVDIGPCLHIWDDAHVTAGRMIQQCILCGEMRCVSGRIYRTDENSGSMLEYDDNGNLTKEYLVSKNGYEIRETINVYENGMIVSESNVCWSPDHKEKTESISKVHNGSFLYDGLQFENFDYELCWTREDGYSAAIYSHIYPEVNQIAELYGDRVALRKTKYHSDTMAALEEEIRTNKDFDPNEYEKMDDDAKKETLKRIAAKIAEICQTHYKDLYICMEPDLEGKYIFEDKNRVPGEAQFDRKSRNLYIKNAKGDLADLVGLLAHELRHAVQTDMTVSKTPDPKYTMDPAEADHFLKQMKDSMNNYIHNTKDLNTKAQMKEINAAAEEIAEQLSIPKEYRNAFCDQMVQQVLTYRYRTQLCEADAFTLQTEVEEMMKNRER